MKTARYATGASLASLVLLLAACGGGGVSSTPAPAPAPTPSPGPAPSPTPSPSPTPTPAPSPTPTPTPIGMNAPLTADATFQTAGLVAVTGGAVAGIPLGEGVELRYSVADDTITVVDPSGEEYVFLTPQIPPGEVFSYTHEYVLPFGSSGLDRKQVLRLSVPVVDGVILSYTRIGVFSNYEAGGQLTGQRLIFGIPTTTMPGTGTANYSTRIFGAAALENFDGPEPVEIHDLPFSNGSFSIDFATGQIATSINFVGRDPMNPMLERDFETVSGTGGLESGGPSFTGTFATDSGTFGGSFFGPAAVEMGYSFQIESGNFRYTGDMVGLKD